MSEMRVAVAAAAAALAVAVVLMPTTAARCEGNECLASCERCTPAEPAFEQVYHEVMAANEAYAIAREQALRAISKHRNESLIVDDLTMAVGYGDDAVTTLQTAGQWAPKHIEEVVRLLWSVVAHIVNATLGATARI